MVAETGAEARRWLAADMVADAEVVGLIGTGHSFSHFVLLALPPLFPLLRADLGLSYTQLGLLLTMASLSSGATQVGFGFLVDRFGAVPVLLGGIVFQAAGLFFLGLGPAYTVMLGLALLIGLGNATYHPADYAILAARINERRVGRAFAIHNFTGYVGWAIAPVGMAFLAGHFGWHGALMMAGAAGLAIALLLAAQRRRLDDAARRAERLARRGASSGGSLAALLNLPVLLCFLFFVLMSTGLTGLNAFAVSAFTTLYQMPIETASSTVTLFFIGSAFGVLTGGVIADRTGRHQIVAICGILASASLILLLSQHISATAAMAVMGLAGFCNGIVMPSRDMIVRAAAPAGQIGKVFGLVSTGLDVGGMITPLIFGALMDHGMPSFVFVASATATLLAGATVLTTRKRRLATA